MKMHGLLLVSIVLLSSGVALAQVPDKMLTTSRQPMKDLLAEGYEIRSHQFFRCTATPEKDDAYSCVNVLMQKGKKFATCNFDRNKFLFEGAPIAPSCAVFE
jgi:hypothetical protein